MQSMMGGHAHFLHLKNSISLLSKSLTGFFKKDLPSSPKWDWTGAMRCPPWPLKSWFDRCRPMVGENLSWITPGPVPIPLPEFIKHTKEKMIITQDIFIKVFKESKKHTCHFFTEVIVITRHLSKHISKPSKWIPVKFHPGWHKRSLQKEVTSHSLRQRRRNKNSQILKKKVSWKSN